MQLQRDLPARRSCATIAPPRHGDVRPCETCLSPRYRAGHAVTTGDCHDPRLPHARLDRRHPAGAHPVVTRSHRLRHARLAFRRLGRLCCADRHPPAPPPRDPTRGDSVRLQHPGRMALCGSPLCRLSVPGRSGFLQRRRKAGGLGYRGRRGCRLPGRARCADVLPFARRDCDRRGSHPPCERRSVGAGRPLPRLCLRRSLARAEASSRRRRCWTISTIAATWRNAASTA